MKRAALLWVLATYLFLLPAQGYSQQGSLYIYHIDVGQGDSTLVVSPAGKTLLIDAGNNGMGNRQVLPLLKKLRIPSLDYVIATHYDADHIGGLDEVVDALQALGGAVGVAYDRGEPDREDTSRTYKDYVDAVRSKRKTIAPGVRIDLGAAVSVLTVAVNGKVLGGRSVELGPRDENDASVALTIRYRGFDYFIGGDLTGGGRSGTKRTKDVESRVASVAGDVDVLKVNHHGSQTSSNERFLTALHPEVAVISVGNGGSNRSRYRHPSREVLDRFLLLQGLVAIFQTNRGETRGGLTARDRQVIQIANGDVVLSTDGRTYLINGRSFPVDEGGPGQ